MNAEVIIAIGSLVTAISGIGIAILTNRSAATKAELDSLKETIRLQREELNRYADWLKRADEKQEKTDNDNKEMRDCINNLENENKTLESAIEKIQREREETMQERDALRAELDELKNRRLPAMDSEISVLRQMVKDLGGKPPTGPLATSPLTNR